MKCRVCGSELEPNATICRVCGVSAERKDYTTINYDQLNSFRNSISNNDLNNRNFQNFQNNSFNSQQVNQNPNQNFFQSNTPNEVRQQNFNNYYQNRNSNSTPSAPQQNNYINTNLNTNNNFNKKNNNKIISNILISIIFLILVVISGYFLSKIIFSTENDKPIDKEIIFTETEDNKKEENPKENDNHNKEDENIGNDNNNQEEPPSNQQFISLDNYTFTIPTGYKATVEEDCLIFKNDADRIQVIIAIYNGVAFQLYVDQISTVINQWTKQGYQINANTQKQYGNSTWLIFDAIKNATIMNIVYRDLGSSNTAELIIVNDGNTNKDDLFNLIENMLNTSSYQNNVNNNNPNLNSSAITGSFLSIIK